MIHTKLHKPLYKRDTKGKIRVWQMELGWNDEGRAGHRSHTGIKDGRFVVSEWKSCLPKNVGKANETTSSEQGQSEICSLYTQKLDTGYFASESDIDTFDKFKPMLAVEYKEDKIDFEESDYYSQPKLDGIRCIARRDGLYTRAGKPITSCPHIIETLKPVFDIYPNAILDGELYNHVYKDDFNKIVSMVRKTKLKDEDYEESRRLVQYHVYDYFVDSDFNERYDALAKLKLEDPVITVKTDRVSSMQKLDFLNGEYLAEGYEGQMIRLNSKYQNKRSKYLMKRKEFLSDEFKVIRTEQGQGNWAGYVKRFILELPDGTQFGAGVRGNQETMKTLYESNNTPDWATLRYFTPTPDGIPRFPVVVDWGNGQRED